jgi:serine/threonine protein phosphatase 1
MRTLVVGDIHGGLRALKEVLQKAKATVDDKLIFLGDYVDGWSESPQTLDYLLQLKESHNCVVLRGNHDDLLLNWFNTNQTSDNWLRHGGQSTLDAYQSLSKTQKNIHAEFILNMPTYHIDSKNRLFVHAGFANLHGPEYEFYSNTVYWDRTLWEMALATDKDLSPEDSFYPKRLKLFSEIYIGHTPTNRYGQHTPMQAQNVFNLDTAAAYKGPLTMMDVDSKNYWQSTPVHELYPGEPGRN